MHTITHSLSALFYRLQKAWSPRDAIAMQVLSPLYQTYLPWSAASMRPASIVVVLNDILVNRRRSVVECGSGVSTYFIAKLLQGLGGRLLTIDHDERWLLTVKGLLTQESLADGVTCLHAPLAPSALAPGACEWYDTHRLDQAMQEFPKIDLLLVDGPPACRPGAGYSRYPALPYFRPYFQDDFTICLHDIDRTPEWKIIALWSKSFGLKFELRLFDDRIAIGRTAGTFAV
jgi:hypothetical protein